MDSESHLSVFDREMRLRGFRPATQETYHYYLARFLREFGDRDHPKNINEEEIKEKLDLIGMRSKCELKQTIGAAKFFWGEVLHQPRKLIHVQYPIWHQKLPEVIDRKVLAERIQKIEDVRDRAIVSTFFDTGIRLNELCHLKVSDIPKDRPIIIVREGKGGKDRIVPRTRELREILGEYWLQDRPDDWLFPGEKLGNYISPVTVQRITRDCVQAHPHQIRHSYATALLEKGTPLPIIQAILGHKNITTTMRYLHVSNQALQMVSSNLLEIAA